MEKIKGAVGQADFYLNLKTHFGAMKSAQSQLVKDVDELRTNSLILANELSHHKESLERQDNSKQIEELRMQNALLAQEINFLKERLMYIERREEKVDQTVLTISKPPKQLPRKRNANNTPNA